MLPSYYTNEIQNAIILYAYDGVGLYGELKRIHTLARAAGDSVVYPEGETLNITIPNNPEPIKLSPYTDFNLCLFKVTNTVGEATLFTLMSDNDPENDPNYSVSIDKSLLNKNSMVYGSNNELTSAPKLLIVKDENPWTYRYGTDAFKRKDIFFVTGNEVQNDPIATYDNDYSSPSCIYEDVSTEQKIFKRIEFRRMAASTAVTNLLKVQYQYNVLLQYIHVDTRTPASPFYKDSCISIEDSAMISIENCLIEGTYSGIYNWGYGIRLLNVWNSYISNLTADSTVRGVMGNEHVNGLTVENSTLNRVDVHCYGRDITCNNCTFRNTNNTYHIYNRVSSFFGKLIYNNCTFDSFLPLRIDSDYNAFTPFDLILDNCTLIPETNHKSLIDFERFGAGNNRHELQQKCLPNIEIRSLHLNIPSTITDFYFIRTYNYDYTGSIYYMNTFVVDVIEFTGPSNINIYDFKYCTNNPTVNNNPLTLAEPLRQNINMIHNIVGGS